MSTIWAIFGATYVGAHGESENVEDGADGADDHPLLLTQQHPLVHDGRTDRLYQSELQRISDGSGGR